MRTTAHVRPGFERAVVERKATVRAAVVDGKDALTDAEYRKAPPGNLDIDTPQQIQSFMVRTYDAYRRKLSVEEYARWLNASYPGHEYEVAFITQRLPR